MKELREQGGEPIDLVIVNFYPFEENLTKDLPLQKMVESIDIGGPSMVRAAAKNHARTTVVVDPADYEPVVAALVEQGDLGEERRRQLAAKAFAYTAFYDSLIASYMATQCPESNDPAPYHSVSGRLQQAMRYGENPHQSGSLYLYDRQSPLALGRQLQGKTLSFNNLLDLSMVYEVVTDFVDQDPFCVIVKHQNPCGAAMGENLTEAYTKALETDPRSSFGGIVGFNQSLDEQTARKVSEMFFEVVVAPGFSPEARDILGKKKNLRLMDMPLGYRERWDYKSVPGGFLVQTRDHQNEDPTTFTPQHGQAPSEKDLADIRFGWTLIRYVKSNAIILVRDRQLLGVGAGQMSRVDSVEISINKAQQDVSGAILLSDAFFPFADSIETAAAHKIRMVVEPGGSVRDEEVIEAARRLDISLLFTSVRHFRH